MALQALATVALLACRTGTAPAAEDAPVLAVEQTPEAAPSVPVGQRLARVVAIGDLHADEPQALKVLQLAGLVDEEGTWAGGDATFVQTGDVTDRGPDSKQLIDWMARLEDEAAAAGGRVVALNGNHEVMNLLGDWRYVADSDVDQFGGAEARKAALAPDGEQGARLRELGVAAVVDRVAYAHGGITAAWAEKGIEGINATPLEQLGTDSPIWFRGYLQDDMTEACAELERALLTLGAERMVVGHTTQRTGRIASRCGGRVLGIDVGIASHYGGNLAVLELRNGEPFAIYAEGEEAL